MIFTNGWNNGLDLQTYSSQSYTKVADAKKPALTPGQALSGLEGEAGDYQLSTLREVERETALLYDLISKRSESKITDDQIIKIGVSLLVRRLEALTYAGRLNEAKEILDLL